jgi:hypothetical protein
MREKLRFLGLDVHAETIAVAVAEPDGEVRSLGTSANREESIRKLIRKLGPPAQLRACYEAGPTGFVLYWQLVQLGVECAVVAPTLVPRKAGDRVKTDWRDALKLARSHRTDDLTAVWVPDEGSEALRDLVRAGEAAKQDQLRARHRLTKFLLRTGQRPPAGSKDLDGTLRGVDPADPLHAFGAGRGAQLRRRSWGARLSIPACSAHRFTAYQTTFAVTPASCRAPFFKTRLNTFPSHTRECRSQASTSSLHHDGTGTVLSRPPLPTKSTMTQWPSLVCSCSRLKPTTSERRNPHPSSSPSIAPSLQPREFFFEVALTSSCA